ncbi:hypothetical protein DV736_g3014, partial [Chaetothyriales sp. CBS 134916]
MPLQPPSRALLRAFSAAVSNDALVPRHKVSRIVRRPASSTAHPPDKPIVLEQPDKFRPPSHPSRLVRGTRPNTFGSGYNQTSTAKEQAEQKTRRYPHTFPNQGTVMYKFLTNRSLHVFITLGTLTILACISLITTFTHTSPYAHLLPNASSLLWHPWRSLRECASVYKLDMDYRTAQAFESRQQNMLDAQKRRLYRRAHGMEDLNAEYDQGVDVRGIAPWDDGLTKREREKGEVDWDRKGDAPVGKLPLNVPVVVDQVPVEQRGQEQEQVQVQAQQEPRKRKLWLGIWYSLTALQKMQIYYGAWELWTMSSKPHNVTADVELRFITVKSGKTIKRSYSKKQLKCLPFPNRDVQARMFNCKEIRVTAERPVKCLVFEERTGCDLSGGAIDVMPGDEQVTSVRGLNEGDSSQLPLDWTCLGANEQ